MSHIIGTEQDDILFGAGEDDLIEGLGGAFDAARAANPGLTTWALSDALTQHHLGGSDDAALGGDLAYLYGVNGTLSGVSFEAAQSVMTASNYATHPRLGS